MLTKYARFEVLSAHLAQNRLARTAARDVIFNRTAHRHAFKYDPKPGFLYVRSRAISSRCNDNFDDFPADEIKQAYATFVGKPVFVNHNNANHRRMRGVCIDAALHEDANPDGTPDTWVEVLMEIDAVRFPKLAQAILAGHIDRTSMGTDVAFSLCSFCGNKASTPLEYCNHIPKLKGKRIRRVMANGEKQDVLVREICHGLRFFENSVLVEPPADPTAYFLGVEVGPGVQTTVAKGQGRHHPGPDEYVGRCSACRTKWCWPNTERTAPMRFKDKTTMSCPRCAGDVIQTTRMGADEFPFNHLHEQQAMNLQKRASTSLATRYECQNALSPQCARGEGKPTRKKCGYCGGSLRTEQGLYGVFPWTRENRYPHGDAVSTHTSKKKAEAAADSDEGRVANHVVRWIPANSIQSSLQRAGVLIADHIPQEPKESALSRAAALIEQAIRAEAYGEVVAPAKVDTMRDEACPVCGESDTFDGDKCMVCGYVKPPDEFMDPDLEVARNTDLRQETDDALDMGGDMGSEDVAPGPAGPGVGAGDLTCDNCGQSYPSGDMASTDPLGNSTNTGDEFNDAEADPTEVQTDDENAAKPDKDWTTDPAKLPHLTKPKKPDQEDASQPDGALPRDVDDASAEDTDDTSTQGEGDTCPNCGKGTLKSNGDSQGGDGDAFVPPTKGSPQDGAEDEDEEEDDDDEDGKGKKKPPWMKDKKSSALSRAAELVRRCEADEQKENSMRPALAALAEQQKVITAQEREINGLRGAVAFIAEAAGLREHPAITAVLDGSADMQHVADVNNPAQPLPDPGSAAPEQTTQEALAPAGHDDPESIGASPVNSTAPAAVTSLDDVGGVVANEPLDLNEHDVTAPVAGTEGPRPLNEVKTEVEQRIGPWQGNDPAPAFPLQGPFAERARTSSVTEGRTIACLRLARLRMQAGIAAEATDDLSLGTEIAQGDMSDEMVQAEIDTLGKVVTQAKRQPVSRNLVPQAAPARAPQQATAGVQRTVPSMASPAPAPRTDASGPIQASAALMAPDDSEFMFE